ncbi:hypothetical protein, partial [Microbacterium sp.]|uniref:hypothetical protein n=1 Tax=Microbacterium sp. TaxID=51671 RepID=UPI002733332D
MTTKLPPRVARPGYETLQLHARVRQLQRSLANPVVAHQLESARLAARVLEAAGAQQRLTSQAARVMDAALMNRQPAADRIMAATSRRLVDKVLSERRGLEIASVVKLL